MVIDCPQCECKVDAKVIGEHESYDHEQDPAPFRASLLECPKCKYALLGGQYYEQYDDERGQGREWDNAFRLWPRPSRGFSWAIPHDVQLSLHEATKCFGAGAYAACTIMCGRALEQLCRDQGAKSKTLAAALKELLQKEAIDGRLFAWADELRKARNLGAHGSDSVSKLDASDLLDFLNAICDYVYELNTKFRKFMTRRSKLES